MNSTLTVWLPQNRAETHGPAFGMVRTQDWVWVRPRDEIVYLGGREEFERAVVWLGTGDAIDPWNLRGARIPR